MAQLLNYILKPIVPIIHINGSIGVTHVVNKSIQEISRAKALAVVVNSQGGYPAQCEVICNQLKHYAHSHKIPLYTFCEDYALSGGYFILSVGDRVFADSSSMVGSVGVLYLQLIMKDILTKQGIDIRKFRSNDNLFTSHQGPWADINDEQNTIIQKSMTNMSELFKQHVSTHRKQISQQPEDIQQLIYNANIFSGEDALKYGLIDGIGTYDDILRKLYPECELRDVTWKSHMNVLMDKVF